MYYELFNKVFEDNENTICIFEIGAFYIVLTSYNLDTTVDYTHKQKGFKKTEVMKDLHNCGIVLVFVTFKIYNMS